MSLSLNSGFPETATKLDAVSAPHDQHDSRGYPLPAKVLHERPQNELPPRSDLSGSLNDDNLEDEFQCEAADADEWQPIGPDGQDEHFEVANVKPLSNADSIEVEGEDGSKSILVPVPIRELIRRIKLRCENWPRRVGSALFVHDRGAVSFLTKSSALFGFIGARTGIVKWHKVTGAPTKDEVFAEFQRTATSYHGIEKLPNEPPIEGHYYACEIPEAGDGRTLRDLVGRFNPATEIDRDLILAAFVSVMWGGVGGSRPLFVITSDDGRGAGKSKFASVLAHLAGGAFDLSPNEDISAFKTRCLTTDALTKRVVIIDNVKSHRFSWAEFEGLVTAPEISGKQNYVGEGTRPNTVLYLLTLNGASLSTDIAQRSVIVKLKRPTYSATWFEDTIGFIDANREKLIADIIGFLRSERTPLLKYSRWGAWERDILSRLPEPSDTQAVIVERQGASDVEGEESDIVEAHFREQLCKLGYNARTDIIRVPVAIAAQWLGAAVGDKLRTSAASRALGQMIDEGRLKVVQRDPCRTFGRCFLWLGEDSTPSAVAMNDVNERIAQLTKRHPF